MRRQTFLVSTFATLSFGLLCACNHEAPCGPGEIRQGNACLPAGEIPPGEMPSGETSCTPVENTPPPATCTEKSRLYAACYASGHVAVLSPSTRNLLARERVGDNPQALSSVDEVLLCADDGAQRLWRLEAQSLQKLGEVATGQLPNHVSVSEDKHHAYIINAASGTLQVVDTQTWKTLPATVYFGENTYPQTLALMGSCGFVPLYGNLAGGQTAPGQRLARVNLSHPTSPRLQGEADFSSLHLYPYAGRTPIPLPYDVVVHKGFLYVALNNLAADYNPAGPGAIAKVNPHTLEAEVLLLGDTCLNVVSLASHGEWLLASCFGEYGNPGTAGVALMEDDKLKNLWTAPPGFVPGALATPCGELWVGNANGGDIYVFSTQEGRLQLLRGVGSLGEGGSEGGPVGACPPGPMGYSSVESLWLKP